MTMDDLNALLIAAIVILCVVGYILSSEDE